MSAKIVLCAEAWGANEWQIQQGLVGSSGIELLKMMDEAGMITLSKYDKELISQFWFSQDPNYVALVWQEHPEIYRTNVFNFHPPGNDLGSICCGKKEAIAGYPALLKAKFCPEDLRPELDRLAEELCTVNPNIIVALGNTASWALIGQTAISKRRGTLFLSTHTVSGFKVLPTYHPAAVMRQWELRTVTVLDLAKASREAAFPELIRPERHIWIEPELEDLERFYNEHIRECRTLSVDIETAGTQITCIGFAPSHSIALVVPFLDLRRARGNYWPNKEAEQQAWGFVRRVLAGKERKVFQNGLYDISFLWRSYKIPVRNAEHDTMLLHHALHPESPKGLDFLGSVYTNEASWKLMRPRGKQTIKREE